MQHVINRQTFEINCKTEDAAKLAQTEIENFVTAPFTAIISRVLTELESAYGPLQINRLEIDLGDLEAGELGAPDAQNRFHQLFADGVKKHIGNLKPVYLKEGNKKSSGLLQSWLRHGDLPWWKAKSDDPKFDLLVRRLLKEDPVSLKKLAGDFAAEQLLGRLLPVLRPATAKRLAAEIPAFAGSVLAKTVLDKLLSENCPHAVENWIKSQHRKYRRGVLLMRKGEFIQKLFGNTGEAVQTAGFTAKLSAVKETFNQLSEIEREFIRLLLQVMSTENAVVPLLRTGQDFIPVIGPSAESDKHFNQRDDKAIVKQDYGPYEPSAGQLQNQPASFIDALSTLQTDSAVNSQGSAFNRALLRLLQMIKLAAKEYAETISAETDSMAEAEKIVPETTTVFGSVHRIEELPKEIPDIRRATDPVSPLETLVRPGQQMRSRDEKELTQTPLSSTVSMQKTPAFTPVIWPEKIASTKKAELIQTLLKILKHSDRELSDFLNQISEENLERIVQRLSRETPENAVPAKDLNHFIRQYPAGIVLAFLQLYQEPKRKNILISGALNTAKKSLTNNELSLLKHIDPSAAACEKHERKLLKRLVNQLPAEAKSFISFLSKLKPSEISQDLLNQTESEKTQGSRQLPEEPLGKIYIENAGLCLIVAYLGGCFKRLGYTENGKFISRQKTERAVQLIQFIATGEKRTPEYQLQFNKLLCGIALSDVLQSRINLTRKETDEAEQLIAAALQHWKSLKSTSIEGFRSSFLQRQGILEEEDLKWTLRVEKQGFDMLLNTIPWGYTLIKLPWMKKHLQAEW